MGTPEPPPGGDRGLNWLNAVKGLTVSNVLVIALLAVITVPVYVIYKAVADPQSGLMDRLMSTYEEIGNQQSGCTLRHVQERGGPELWGISAGFAFQGSDRWFVNVVLTHDPSANGEEVASYCESLKLIADRMLSRDGDDGGNGEGDVQPGSVPGAAPDRGGHDRLVPSAAEEEEK